MASNKEVELKNIGRINPRNQTSANDWIAFLTEKGYYVKTIRTLEEAKIASDKQPIVIYPDVNNINRFFIYKRDNGATKYLEYTEPLLIEIIDDRSDITQLINLKKLKADLGIQTGGRRRSRRRSRKAKKNKAHTPQ